CDSMHGDPRLGRLLASGDVDVIEDLEVVGEELQGHDQDLGDPGGAEPREKVLDVRRQPLLGRVPGALVREAPSLVNQTKPRGDRACRVTQLGDVTGVAVDDLAREAVGSEDDRTPGTD